MAKEFITLYQRPALPFPTADSMEYKFIMDAGANANTLIFPEYFTFHSMLKNPDQILENSRLTINALLKLSVEPALHNTMVVGGTVIIEKKGFKYNAAPILFNGAIVDFYYKRKLFLNERQFLSAGSEKLTLQHPVTNDSWGFLICADVQTPEFFDQYHSVKFIAIPVASPYKPDDTPESQSLRDKTIFVDGSLRSGAILFKCCLAAQTGVMENIPVNEVHSKVQGRSLIADSKQILAKAPHIQWSGTLSYSPVSKTANLIEYPGEL